MTSRIIGRLEKKSKDYVVIESYESLQSDRDYSNPKKDIDQHKVEVRRSMELEVNKFIAPLPPVYDDPVSQTVSL